MIAVVFVTGMFGSTVEYLLEKYTRELHNPEYDRHIEFLADGSMHNVGKRGHIYSKETISRIDDDPNVITMTYPTPSYTLRDVGIILPETYERIVIYTTSKELMELVFLLQYNKLVNTKYRQMSLDRYFNLDDNMVKYWNEDYTTIDDFTIGDYRSWRVNIHDWFLETHLIEKNQVFPKNSHLIDFADLVDNFEGEFDKIIERFKLTVTDKKELKNFFVGWKRRQQYIFDQYEQVDTVVNTIIDGKAYVRWGNLNLMQEVLIKYRLRAKGIEIDDYNLESYPTHSKDMWKYVTRNTET